METTAPTDGVPKEPELTTTPTEQQAAPETKTNPAENESEKEATSEIIQPESESAKKAETVDVATSDKPKTGEEKSEGTKGEGDNESLEVLVDDTQNDLDADLKSEGGETAEAKATGDAEGAKTGDAAETTDAAKPADSTENKTGDGESKPEEKKPDDAKRLVGFV